jgi:predicted RNase H-like HicB family nuclease
VKTTLKFGVYIERDRAGNYISSVAELPGCHAKARSIEAVMAKIVDAVDVYLDAENHETESIYELVDIKVIDVPKREVDLAAFK